MILERFFRTPSEEEIEERARDILREVEPRKLGKEQLRAMGKRTQKMREEAHKRQNLGWKAEHPEDEIKKFTKRRRK